MSHAVLSHVSIILGQFHHGYLQDAYTYNTSSFTELPLDRSLSGEQGSSRTVQGIAKRLCAFSALSGEQESYKTVQGTAKRLCAFSALPAAPKGQLCSWFGI